MKKQLEDTNLYLSILKYGAEKLDEDTYVDLEKLVDYINKKGFKFDINERVGVAHMYIDNIFRPGIPRVFAENAPGRGYKVDRARKLLLDKKVYSSNDYLKYMTIKIDRYQEYLNYTALNEARSSSQKAQWTAIIAILLTCAALIFSYIQLHQSQKMDPSQFNQLLNKLR